jgi:hypothetical protein
MRQWPLERTRTPEKSCVFEAECEIDGRRYSARSRHGAPNELARLLVSVGIADQPVEVSHAGIRGCITYRSLHDLGRWAYQESAAVPLRRVRWKPPTDVGADIRKRKAQNRGDSPGVVGEDQNCLKVGFEHFVSATRFIGQEGRKLRMHFCPTWGRYIEGAGNTLSGQTEAQAIPLRSWPVIVGNVSAAPARPFLTIGSLARRMVQRRTSLH